MSEDILQSYCRWAENVPERLGRFRVSAVDRQEGIKFWLGKHDWALVRP